MNTLVKFRKLSPNAVAPAYAKPGDAGLDLVATSKREVNEIVNLPADHEQGLPERFEARSYIQYGTGLAFEIPKGFVGLIFPRSSLSNKGLMLTNHVGVVDSGYRGEVSFRFKRTLDGVGEYEVGDRIGQLIVIPYPVVQLEEVQSLTDSSRGDSGFGSSGK